ncbi:MAG TPA: hypothetical protein VJ787_01365, partial [Thermoleophilia bacterium]|nr:hypothetical protein [Thermoleophilia bacterium]
MDIDTVTRRVLSSASLCHKVRRRLYHRTATKRQVVVERSDFYRDVWEEAAGRHGGTVTVLRRALLEIRCGDVVLRTRTNLTSLDDQLTVAVAEDKALVYRLLGDRDIAVPRHALCPANDLRAAWSFAGELRRPCVVKPARASGAIGVTTAVTTRRELAVALAYAGAFGSEVLIEELIAGGVYRLLYFDG